MKYYYGMEDQEIYTADDPYTALEEIENEYDNDMLGMIIVEMKSSKKSGVRWCSIQNIFIEGIGWCGKNCIDYKPRNRKSGICKYIEWSLIETGRKWKITGKDKLKKISGRIN